MSPAGFYADGLKRTAPLRLVLLAGTFQGVADEMRVEVKPGIEQAEQHGTYRTACPFSFASKTMPRVPRTARSCADAQ